MEISQTTLEGVVFWAKVESFGWMPASSDLLMMVLAFINREDLLAAGNRGGKELVGSTLQHAGAGC